MLTGNRIKGNLILMSHDNSFFVSSRGARLFVRTRGSGPPLLVLQGGPHDADGANAVADRLAGDFTVIGMDRRGLSRSLIDDPGVPVTVALHADDALAVLDAVSPEPAIVVGSSIGALIGLDAVARRPDRVRVLVAHEPPVPELLAGAERAQLVRLQEDVEETYRREGAAAAMRIFGVALGVDPQDGEDGLERPTPSPHVAANLEFFLTHDAPAVRTYRLDLAPLRAAAHRILPAVGERSRVTMHGAGGLALARALGVEAVELPGGHGGYATHPTAFAAKLCALLRDPTVPTRRHAGSAPV
jgi:pimeloyl-ACP methyl ester carboxylesterase